MSTEGKKWKRTKGILWTDEIFSWIKERIPAKEHGYTSRQQMLEELNQTFNTTFTIRAFCTHCYEKGIQLGLCHSNSAIARGEKHWRHRPVGSFQEKKGYVRIKVGEPNQWMQYQRYVWEQNHPGESAEGKTVIFMDGNNRNFEPSNLECVTRGELSVMAELGCSKECSVDERRTFLLMARIKIAKVKLFGKEYQKTRAHMLYLKVKDTPEYKAKVHAQYLKRKERYQNDPEYRKEQQNKANSYRKKHYAESPEWRERVKAKKRK